MIEPGYEVLARVDLGTVEPLQDGSGHRIHKETGVVLGRPVVARLTLANFPPSFRERVDAARWAYYLIRFPFDLEEHPAGLRYLEARYQVALDDGDISAQQLDLVPIAADRPALAPGEELTRFGIGQRIFTWRLRGALSDGSRVARVLLQVPPGLTALDGLINVSATLADPEFGPEATLEVRQAAPQPFRLDLADGTFTRFPPQAE